MARDDSFLNTGLSSASARKLAEANKERIKGKREVRARLTPQAEIILDWIAQERHNVGNIEHLIMNMDSEENVRAVLLAKKMHLEYLNSLATKIQNILRVQKQEADHE